MVDRRLVLKAKKLDIEEERVQNHLQGLDQLITLKQEAIRQLQQLPQQVVPVAAQQLPQQVVPVAA